MVRAIARADFLERVRSYGFLVALLFAVCLGIAAATGRISIRLGDFRGLYTSAWIGAMMALVTTSFCSLVGFYVVKNAIDRDRRTRVGQILAATPLSKAAYLIGKFLSNAAVLAVMVGVLALCSLVMQVFIAEDPRFHPWGLLSPFLLLALPAMCVTAACAVVFETIPGLRGGLGNVIWFFVWGLALGPSAMAHNPLLDVFGLGIVFDSMIPCATATIPGYDGGFALAADGRPVRVCAEFCWGGIEWTAAGVLSRFAWIAMAPLLAVAGALLFDRFDPSRALRQARGKRNRVQVENAVASAATVPQDTCLTPLPDGARSSALVRLILAELRLTLKGYPWWWYAVGAGLLVGQCLAPVDVARGPLLAAAWLWPVLLCSSLGTREEQFGTRQILFACPRIVPRQVLAAWMAVVLIVAGLGAGTAVRLVLLQQGEGLLAWAAGAVFVPSLALALGVWSGSRKFFEALYTVLWYLGPLNRIPGLDFTGTSSGPATGRFAVLYLTLSAILVVAALVGRARQLRRV